MFIYRCACTCMSLCRYPSLAIAHNKRLEVDEMKRFGIERDITLR